jgi:hypothetical protein
VKRLEQEEFAQCRLAELELLKLFLHEMAVVESRGTDGAVVGGKRTLFPSNLG